MSPEEINATRKNNFSVVLPYPCCYNCAFFRVVNKKHYDWECRSWEFYTTFKEALPTGYSCRSHRTRWNNKHNPQWVTVESIDV